MEFERARTQEQKNVRISEIVEATIKQYNEIPYENITLASISKELSFSRVNLYKYFKTKEEIFLKIIELDIYKFIDRLKLIFMGQPSQNIESFASKWSIVLYSQSRMIELLSKLFSELEKNSSVEKLAEFKVSFFQLNDELYDILKAQIPRLNKKQIYNFISTHNAFAAGLYPMCKISENQKKSLELTGHEYTPPDFVKTLSSFIVTYVKGLKS